MSTFLEPISAKDEEEAVEAFAKVLRVVRPHAKLLVPDGSEISVPASIYNVLEQVIPLLLTEHAVSIVPIGTVLTTHEAAELLNVSRPHLMKLLESGAISFDPSAEPGSRRKIRFADVMKYKRELEIERKQQLRTLTESSQDAGLYED